MSPRSAANSNGAPKAIVLIDADGALYSAALNGQALCDGEPMQLLDDEYIYADAINRIRAQAKLYKGEVQEVFICLTDRTNFRTEIMPAGHPGSIKGLGYKGQRPNTPRPLALDALRAAIVERREMPVMLIKGLEADDVCGIAAGTFVGQGYKVVLVSPDKDLATIPNVTLIRPRPGNTAADVLETTQASADAFHMYQTLVGDTCDNYKGCPGYGPKKAGVLLDMCEEEGLTAAQRWGEIVMAFADAGLTEDDALVQARVSRILRLTDWDADKKEPILWVPPVAPAPVATEQKAA